ncbi:hypothetical protein ACFOKF_15485 [Sphingobium rhizovicinum]|uniref:Uncharacterized protein n=1 Tax=Sphingobium rhizovicinum TaxID=432308 RepID=A0ABV7NJS5_9SPHN
MTAALPDADRFRRAREEFSAAMEAGCSILELRRRHADQRARLRERAQQSVAQQDGQINGKQGFFVIDEAADFQAASPYWWMRD